MNPRSLRATCPACTRVLTGVELGGEFPPHYTPPGPVRRRCVFAGSVVRRTHLVHPCITCAALPEPPDRETGQAAPQGYRPQHPRALDPKSTPRLPECATHREARVKAQKARRNAAGRERGRGIAEQDRDTLWAAQGSACICGRKLRSTGKAPSLDHDHARADALCDHDPKKACRRCARGALCDTCNRVLVGRYSPTQLRMVARYMETPTAQLLGWWDDEGE